MEAAEVAAAQGSAADQQQTLVLDFSPTVRTFFGGAQHETIKKELIRENEDDADSINGRTRRLDSFALPEPTAAEPTPPLPGAGSKPEEIGESKSEESESSIVPRNLASVFDQEAHQLEIKFFEFKVLTCSINTSFVTTCHLFHFCPC